MEAGWKCSALRRKNVFIKHSVWAKFTPVLGVRVTFTPHIFSTDWIRFPHLPVGNLSFLHTVTIFPNLVSWGSLGAFSICILGPYITLNGPTTQGRRWLLLFVLTWGSRFQASWALWLKTQLSQVGSSNLWRSDKLTPLWMEQQQWLERTMWPLDQDRSRIMSLQ